MNRVGSFNDGDPPSLAATSPSSSSVAPASTSPPSIEDERVGLQRRLETLRRRRRKVLGLHQRCEQQEALILDRLNGSRLDLQEAVDEYSSILTSREANGIFLEYAQRWNVTNDCFHIWNNGGFATINGCRLGSDAPPLPPSLMVENNPRNVGTSISTVTNAPAVQRENGKTATSSNGSHHPNNKQSVGNSPQSPPRQQQQQQQQQQRRYLGFIFSSSSGNQTDTSTSAPKPPPCNPRVPWLEVNAALGHACLLLKILQESAMEKGGTTMELTHELHPMGGTSKIGIRFGSNPKTTKLATPVLYNLFFEENAGFSFFKNHVKNFNLALQAFLQCIAEAAVQQPDKTIAIPHPITHSKKPSSHINFNNFLNGGEWTIGGLSICYPSQTGNNTTNSYSSGGNGLVVGATTGPGGGLNGTNAGGSTFEWTRACKYLLTDLKWLVAYAAKHGDR